MWAALKIFGVKHWLKIAGVVGAALVVGVLWWKADSAWDNYKAAVEAEKIQFTQMAVDKLAVEVERDRAMQAVANCYSKENCWPR
jgi:hypothetical protein